MFCRQPKNRAGRPKLEKNKRIYDITRVLRSGMTVWPGDVPVEINTRDAGDYRISGMRLSVHSGTHLDAPCHFLPGGCGADKLELEALAGQARVVRLNGATRIGPEEIARWPLEGVTRLLIATGDGVADCTEEFDTSFCSLTGEGAQALIKLGIRLVGIDCPSVDLFEAPGHPAHHALMAAGVAIIEGLDLNGINAGDYELICLPLKIENSDGAPARAMLREL